MGRGLLNGTGSLALLQAPKRIPGYSYGIAEVLHLTSFEIRIFIIMPVWGKVKQYVSLISAKFTPYSNEGNVHPPRIR
jgi:hypothetical protein